MDLRIGQQGSKNRGLKIERKSIMSLSKKFYNCCTPPSPFLIDKSARDISSIARRARDQGNTDLSFALLKDGVKLHPDDAYLWRDLGFTLLEVKEFKESLSFFKKAHMLAPHDMKIGMPYARRLRREHMYEDAEKIYMQYMPKADEIDSLKLLESLGSLYFQQNKNDLAAACLGRCIEHGLKNPHAIGKYAKLNEDGFNLNDETWSALVSRLQTVLALCEPVHGRTRPCPQGPA
jgi:tetratricopeptide (TPR) repeat protein